MDETYKRIEMLCNQKHIKVAQMCRDTGVARGIITDFKMGRTKMLSAKTISAIAEYFGVSSDYLISGKKENAPSENEALSKFDGLTKENQEVVMKMIEALLKSQSPD